MGVERRLIRGSDDTRLDLPLLQTNATQHESRLTVSLAASRTVMEEARAAPEDDRLAGWTPP
ncbi:hypothetical protein FFA01_01890 [Frigoribacterium faeni]|uniref:Uncharacterized protein n=1 Tax=Frigoribacterium faeni TaxID=145483 RepID=A0ABQ0ULW4_9MICO|nr:hypothetical protein GCM10025699_47770 [Microbacterium flavescens]GEK81880.1 hypothetical protein FFA01_01890 [Frigoribacterium faeni]